MKFPRSLTFLSAALVAAILSACSSDHTFTAGATQQGGQRKEQKKVVVSESLSAAGQSGSSSAEASKSDEPDFVDDQKFAALIDNQKQEVKSRASSPASHVADFPTYISQTVTKTVLEAQAANPNKLSVEDAHRLAAVINTYADAVIRGNLVDAFRAYKAVGQELAQIKRNRSKNALGLYDNNTFSGRILNFGNGIVDVFAQFYGSIIALDPSLAAGAAESMVRNFMNLLSF